MGSISNQTGLITPGCIPRPRLFASENAKRCHIIRAPSGYGKSVAMAHFCESRRTAGAVAAWTSAWECEYDPCSLTERIYAQIRADNRSGVQSSQDVAPRTFPALASWLRETMGQSKKNIVICVDDIGFHPDIANEIEDFMLAAPAGVEIVVATTAGTGFARVAARQLLREVRADALAFTFEEAKAVEQRQQGARLEESEIHKLWKRTQGWPELLRILLQAAPADTATTLPLAIDCVTGRDQDLDRYFRSAILTDLPGEVRDFCVQASILQPISAEYFNYVFSRTDGAHFIEELSVERLLLNPLDRAQLFFEFHPLVREFLEHRFEIEQPHTKPSLLNKAAKWQRDNGHSRESISLYLRAGERDKAIELASSSMLDIAVRQGEVDQIRLWRRNFSEAASDPMINLGLAWAQIFSHEQNDAKALIAEMRSNRSGRSCAFDQLQIECWCDLISAISEATADNLEQSRRKCETWLDLYGEADLVSRGAVFTCLCFIAASEGRLDDLARLSIEASSINTVAQHRYALAWLHSALIFGEISRGDINSGAALLRGARNDRLAKMTDTPFAANLLDMLELELRYESNQLAGITRSVNDVLDFVRKHGVVDFIHSAFRTAAAIAYNSSHSDYAYELFHEAQVIARECSFPRLDALARLSLADLLMLEDVGKAEAMLPSRDDLVFKNTHGAYLRALRLLTEARIAAQKGKYHLSIRYANEVLDHARRSRSYRLEISALICLAGAHSATGRTSTGKQRVADALDIVERTGCHRTLLDERKYLERLGTVLTPILGLLPEDRPFDQGTLKPQITALYPGIALEGKLTNKEMSILRSIKDGYSNSDIAKKYCISENTVKWHVHNIFSKLNVKNRVQAVKILESQRVQN